MAYSNNDGKKTINNSNNQKPPSKLAIVIMVVIFSALYLATCSDNGSSKSTNHDMGYYERSDGKRIWFYYNK